MYIGIYVQRQKFIYHILLMLVFVSGGEVYTYDYIVYIIRFPVDEVMTTFLYGGKILLFL